MSLLAAIALVALFSVAVLTGYRTGLARFNKQLQKHLQRIKAMYPPHSGHATECELYKDLCITEMLLEIAETDLRQLTAERDEE